MSVINSALRSAAACALLAASSFAPASAEPSSDVLVVYFSATGTTQKAAEAVATELKADLFAIEPVQPYTAADLDYRDPESRSSKEHADPSVRPEYKGDPAGWDQYHTVLIGYPIWWGLARLQWQDRGHLLHVSNFRTWWQRHGSGSQGWQG